MIKTLEQTSEYAKEILETVAPAEEATVLALQGDLGAGKTTFTQALASHLGVQSEITSPTFVIQKIYDLENQKFDRLIHIDAYRLEGKKEIESLGWNEIIADPTNVIVVEWPEKIEGVIPDTALRLSFKTVSETERDIELTNA